MIYEERRATSIEKKAKKTEGKTFLPEDIDVSILQTIKYKYPKNKIMVNLESDEFSCLCPFSGLPDYARLNIKYVPDKRLIELKSLKYYLYAFRNVRVYNEHAVNKILNDLRKVLVPRELAVEAEFTARGGIRNKVSVSFSRNEKRTNR